MPAVRAGTLRGSVRWAGRASQDIAGFCELHVLNSAREIASSSEGVADVVVRVTPPMNVTCETKTERYQRICNCCDLIGRHSPVCRMISKCFL